MSTTVQTAITEVRSVHPAFDRRYVPDAALARFWTRYQRELVSKAIQRNRDFLTAQASIIFAIDEANAVGVAGAGTAGGLPATPGDTPASPLQLPMGPAGELDTSTVVVGPLVVVSATAETLTPFAPGWVVDAYVDMTVVILSGTGAGQRRVIAGNTTDTLEFEGGTSWETTPDTTSVFVISSAVVWNDSTAGTTVGVVASSPFTSMRQAYLVKTGAGGVEYIDLDSPLEARFGVGVPLPPHHYVLGGTVRFTDEPDGDGEDLTIVGFKARYEPRAEYAVRIENGQLWLVGVKEDWEGVASLDLRFVPIPPELTAVTDTFLLPDDSTPALVAAAAYHAAQRINGLEGLAKVDLADFREMKMEAESTWLRSLSVQRRNRRTIIRDWR